MMIKERNKVLYAEVGSDFADVLLSFLTLPLGTIVRLLIKHYGDKAPILRSLNSLYEGLLNLDSNHFWTEAGKLMLLNPRNTSGIQCRRLKLQIDDTPPSQGFVCKNWTCVSMYYDVKCLCGYSTNKETRRDIEAQSGDKSVFTVETTSFLLTDDLQIWPDSPTSLLQCFKLSGIEDTRILEERTLVVGFKEIFELLKGSLVSKTPLTDIILRKSSPTATPKTRKSLRASVKDEPDALPKTQTSKNIGSDSTKITVKALVQKSTNRVLFAQTWQDFIDFLISLLTIPLARVQFLLGNNTCLGSIYNLYRSLSDLETVKFMKSKETITRLLDPQIPPFYLSSYQIFSLNQQSSPAPASSREARVGRVRSYVSTPSSFRCSGFNVIDPKGQDSFVKGPTMFMVTDDLVVSPPSSTSIIFTLNQMKIPVSDVEEHEIDIGMEEALSILQASLTSTSTLTNSFKPFLQRQTKQER